MVFEAKMLLLCYVDYAKNKKYHTRDKRGIKREFFDEFVAQMIAKQKCHVVKNKGCTYKQNGVTEATIKNDCGHNIFKYKKEH